MTTFVLTRPENAKSAIKLGYPTVTEDSDIPSGASVIRWGNGLSPDRRGWSMVLNKSTVLQLSTNKLEALRSLSRTVKTPEIYTHGQTLPRGHRYVARPANHAEGSDFQLINGGVTCPTDHATRFIEDTREYRVWFIRDKYLVARRVPRSSEGQTASDPCRSKWGYEFCSGIFEKLKTEMDKARLAIPLDFGAVDVLWHDESSSWYFLEFNSAPSMDSERVLKHFQTHLKAIVGTQTTSEVVQAERPPSDAPNRRIERPVTPSVSPSASVTWEDRYKAKLLAERKAKEERIYREVYGD